MKAYFSVGCSASGKSTWAKELSKQTGAIIIERDAARREVLRQKNNYSPGDLWLKWNFKDEKLVNPIIDSWQVHAVSIKSDIIFSDTWLNQDRLKAKIAEMESLGYETEVKYFRVRTIDVLYKNDRKRVESVGESVIRKRWLQWLELGEEVTGIKKYVYDEEAGSKAIVVDIDGTVAKMVDRGPFEWDRVDSDIPRTEIIDIVERMSKTHEIIFLSGRDSICREKTEEWIKNNINVSRFQLFMRKERDMRADREIKNELFFNHVAPNYAVDFVIDDRKQMIQEWRDIGVMCINVGCPYAEF